MSLGLIERTAHRAAAASTRLLPWSGTGDPDPHARQRRTSLFGDRQLSVVTKKARSVVALSRVPRGERGAPVFASGCRSRVQGSRFFLRRLSGLLSGCPPTDTRPQARAKLGNHALKRFRHAAQAVWSRSRTNHFGLRHATIARLFASSKIDEAQLPVNGSTLLAARTKLAMMKRPITKKIDCRT